MTVQLRNGKGFEWAIAMALATRLVVPILDNSHSRNARAHHELLPMEKQLQFEKAARVAIEHILSKEVSKLSASQPSSIRVSGDSEGVSGDVRDVSVLSAQSIIFGISCKSNHAAFKHSRLSGTIDWVKAWGLNSSGASQNYWNVVKPVFEELREIQVASDKQALWAKLPNKFFDYYEPVLASFTNELAMLNGSGQASHVSSALARYVIGHDDFYKVIVRSTEVKIMAFNFNGTLSVRRSKLPTSILGMDRFEGGLHSINVRFDRGYTLNFRIHNASSRVEPSLKFDIQAKSLPSEEIYQHHIAI
jgi:hypothetical protein